MTKSDGMSSTCLSGTTANENELGWAEPWTYEVVRLSGAQEPADEFDPGCR